MSAKQKIVHGRGLSNLILGIFVCPFDVCRASKPFPSINFAQINYLPQAPASALAIDKSRYFAQPRPMIVKYFQGKTKQKEKNKGCVTTESFKIENKNLSPEI